MITFSFSTPSKSERKTTNWEESHDLWSGAATEDIQAHSNDHRLRIKSGLSQVADRIPHRPWVVLSFYEVTSELLGDAGNI
jgi:hypothetical protein